MQNLQPLGVSRALWVGQRQGRRCCAHAPGVPRPHAGLPKVVGTQTFTMSAGQPARARMVFYDLGHLPKDQPLRSIKDLWTDCSGGQPTGQDVTSAAFKAMCVLRDVVADMATAGVCCPILDAQHLWGTCWEDVRLLDLGRAFVLDPTLTSNDIAYLQPCLPATTEYPVWAPEQLAATPQEGWPTLLWHVAYTALQVLADPSMPFTPEVWGSIPGKQGRPGPYTSMGLDRLLDHRIQEGPRKLLALLLESCLLHNPRQRCGLVGFLKHPYWQASETALLAGLGPALHELKRTCDKDCGARAMVKHYTLHLEPHLEEALAHIKLACVDTAGMQGLSGALLRQEAERRSSHQRSHDAGSVLRALHTLLKGNWDAARRELLLPALEPLLLAQVMGPAGTHAGVGAGGQEEDPTAQRHRLIAGQAADKAAWDRALLRWLWQQPVLVELLVMALRGAYAAGVDVQRHIHLPWETKWDGLQLTGELLSKYITHITPSTMSAVQAEVAPTLAAAAAAAGGGGAAAGGQGQAQPAAAAAADGGGGGAAGGEGQTQPAVAAAAAAPADPVAAAAQALVAAKAAAAQTAAELQAAAAAEPSAAHNAALNQYKAAEAALQQAIAAAFNTALEACITELRGREQQPEGGLSKLLQLAQLLLAGPQQCWLIELPSMRGMSAALFASVFVHVPAQITAMLKWLWLLHSSGIASTAYLVSRLQGITQLSIAGGIFTPSTVWACYQATVGLLGDAALRGSGHQPYQLLGLGMAFVAACDPRGEQLGELQLEDEEVLMLREALVLHYTCLDCWADAQAVKHAQVEPLLEPATSLAAALQLAAVEPGASWQVLRALRNNTSPLVALFAQATLNVAQHREQALSNPPAAQHSTGLVLHIDAAIHALALAAPPPSKELGGWLSSRCMLRPAVSKVDSCYSWHGGLVERLTLGPTRESAIATLTQLCLQHEHSRVEVREGPAGLGLYLKVQPGSSSGQPYSSRDPDSRRIDYPRSRCRDRRDSRSRSRRGRRGSRSRSRDGRDSRSRSRDGRDRRGSRSSSGTPENLHRHRSSGRDSSRSPSRDSKRRRQQ